MFHKGDKVLRKGRIVEIIQIDYNLSPPSVIVRDLKTNAEIGTELKLLTKIPKGNQVSLPPYLS